MAHLETYTKNDMHGIFGEMLRIPTDIQCYTNKDSVKLELSYLDRSMEHPEWTFIPGTLEEGRQMMKDAVLSRCRAIMGDRKMQPTTNVIGSWAVTIPDELIDDPDKVTKFFDEVYTFTVNRYGRENVIDGIIHYDEGKPHMTVVIVPACISRKSGKPSISAATVFGLKEMHGYQEDLEAAMTKVFGIPKLILNGKTKGGYTTAELKARTAMENKLAEERRSIDDDRNAINEHVMKVNESVDAFNRHASEFEEYKRKCKNEISAERARHEKEMAEERARLAQEREEARNAKEAAEASRRANQSLLASLRGMLRAIREFDAELSERDEERLAEFTKAYEDKKRELAEIDKLFIRDEIEDGSMGAKSEQYFAKRRHGTDSDLL